MLVLRVNKHHRTFASCLSDEVGRLEWLCSHQFWLYKT